jgi:aryl-alcohol dehydrogenase-like predicted oxidoreductase
VYGLGHAEEVLGRALVGRRDEAIVATKVGVRWEPTGQTHRDLSPAWIRQAVDGSLRRLRTDRIDLYQIHWPDPSVPISETMGALVRCIERGKVRYLGCSNLSIDQVEEARAVHPVLCFQARYNIADRAEEPTIRTVAQRFRMATLSYNTLAQGLFSGRYDEASTFRGTDLRQRSEYFRPQNIAPFLEVVRKARAVGETHGKTPLQVAVRWALQAGPIDCAIAGMRKTWQVDEGAGAVDWKLSDDEADFLSSSSLV